MPPGQAAGTFVALTVTQHLDPVRRAHSGRPPGQQGGYGGVLFPASGAGGPVVFADSAWMFYLFAVLFAHRVRGRDDRLPHHQPPVLRQRPHRDHLRVADDGRRHWHGLRRRHRGVAAGDFTADFTYPAIIASGGFTATIAASLFFSSLGVISICCCPAPPATNCPTGRSRCRSSTALTPHPGRRGRCRGIRGAI